MNFCLIRLGPSRRWRQVMIVATYRCLRDLVINSIKLYGVFINY